VSQIKEKPFCFLKDTAALYFRVLFVSIARRVIKVTVMADDPDVNGKITVDHFSYGKTQPATNLFFLDNRKGLLAFCIALSMHTAPI
jgi:hypothetical protein